MQENRRILKSDSGIEYDVSFVPAIINRKYYKRWVQIQTDILSIYDKYLQVYKKLNDGENISKDDQNIVDDLKQLSEDGAESGVNLIIACVRANGYSGFDEDELLENFSEESLSEAINFIMDRVGEDSKKKVKNKKTN